MADMRQIFTYPNNLATDYIDPNYVGDSYTGFHNRIETLIAGAYKTWLNPLAITATTSETMQNISKFGSFYENVSYAGHLSRYDFWQQPLVVATKKLIDSVPMTADATTQPMSVTVTTTGDFNDGMRVTTSGVDGTFGVTIDRGDYPELYAKIISPTEIQLATDQALTNLVSFIGGGISFPVTFDDVLQISGRYMHEDAQGNLITSDYLGSGFWELDLTTVFGSNNVIVPDGSAITFSQPGTSWDNDNLLFGTYYIYKFPAGFPNSPTSEHVYALYTSLPVDFTSQSGRASTYNNLEFPLNGTTFNGTILPGTKKIEIPGAASQLPDSGQLWVTEAGQITWHSGHTFGPNGTEASKDGLPAQSYAEFFTYENKVYDAVNNTTTIEIPNLNSAYWSSTKTATVDFNVSFMNRPQVTQGSDLPPGTMPDNGYGWATVNNARVKLSKPWATDYIDGQAFYIPTGSGNSYPGDARSNNLDAAPYPYYLKSVPALETSTYKIYDVYRNSSMTTLIDLSYYNNFLIPFYAVPTLQTDGSIAFGESAQSLVTQTTRHVSPSQNIYYASNWDTLFGTYIQAADDYPAYGIQNGEFLTLDWNASSSTFTVVGKSQQSTRMNQWPFGVPSDEQTPSPYPTNLAFNYSGGSYDGQPRFWLLKSIADTIINSSNQVIMTPTGPLMQGSGTFWNDHFKYNTTIASEKVFTASSQYITYNNKQFTLMYGGAWDNTSPSNILKDNFRYVPVPSNGPVFSQDIPALNIGRIEIYTYDTTTAPTQYDFNNGTEVTDFPSSFPSRNSGGYPTSAFQTATAAPANYTGVTGTNGYCRFDNPVTQGQYKKQLDVYTNHAKTVANVNFDWTTRPYTGVTNSVDPAGDNYPVGIDVSGTNVEWYMGAIDWVLAQPLQLTMNNSGGTPFVKTVYVKKLQASSYIEFYNDNALTNPYTSTDFISDWTPYIDASDTGYLQVFTQEPVYAPSGGNGFKYGDVDVAAVNSTTRLKATTTSPFVIEYPSMSTMQMTGLYVEQHQSDLADLPDKTSTAIIPLNPNPTGGMTLPLSNSTTGNIGPYTAGGSNPYEIDTVSLLLPGNQKYTYQNSSNVTTPGAQTNTSKYWEAGSTTPSYYTNGAVSAQFTTTVDTDGYLQDVQLVEQSGSEGAYPTGEDIIVLIENRTDQYVPPAPTPHEIADAEDIFDTHDEWVGNLASDLKTWPNHISPASASIVYNQPTIANMSQNGVKYTRRSGFTKWVLEVEYPPMKAKDFQKFHAMAQAMQGQSKSIYFKLRNADDVSILWADMMDTNSSLSALNIPTSYSQGFTPQGSYVLRLEGLTASDPEAFREGEVFLAGENENGSLHTAIGAAASNVFGEARVRMPYPLRSNLAQTAKVDKNPEWAIVTLNSDAFEYSVDVNNYYTLSVAFDLDQWGS